MSDSNFWIGVDFDCTLSMYFGYQSIGNGVAITPMIERVKKWISEGKDVRIFTARVAPSNNFSEEELVGHYKYIENWCKINIGAVLPIVYYKDVFLEEFWDDKAIQLIPNTGIRVDEIPKKTLI
jgi:hypothetical protein